MRMKMSSVNFRSFSKKQMKVLSWWMPQSKYHNLDGIICDGAVRSGKSMCMSVSFITWAMKSFDGAAFAICGKTISSVRRNITSPVLPLMGELGFCCDEKISRNMITISGMGHKNSFYLFGGRDESSASLIQGMTLAGVMLDEVALMPRSFVDQALARLSVEGSKFWFNCNPDHPMHWFCEEWIRHLKEKNCLYIHFVMTDNPSLSPSTIARYERLYTGVFRERYILGKWVAAKGCVYPMFSRQRHVVSLPNEFEEYCVSCDYGTVNPSSFGLWGLNSGKWYRISEYYYDSSKTGIRKTDGEHYLGLTQLIGGRPIRAVVVDPSAASFIEYINRKGVYTVIPASNDVIDGIRKVQDCLREDKILFSEECRDSIREFGLYRWSEKAADDTVIKDNDHAMDDIRYFVSTIVSKQRDDGFFAVFPSRRKG